MTIRVRVKEFTFVWEGGGYADIEMDGYGCVDCLDMSGYQFDRATLARRGRDWIDDGYGQMYLDERPYLIRR